MSRECEVERGGVTSRRSVTAAEIQSSTFGDEYSGSNRGALRTALSVASMMVATTAAAQEGGS